MAGPNVAIVGASGAVGQELLAIIEERGFEHGELRLLASARSAGTGVDFAGKRLEIGELGEHAFDGIDIALFCASGDVARAWAPKAVAAGAVVIDNSSAYRMAPDVPLIVPEVNADALDRVRGKACIIANPNCSTIIMMVGVDPIRRRFGLERVVVSTYQAVSGAGAAAIEELRAQAAAVLAGQEPKPEVFIEPCAFNVFSHDSAMDLATGRNVEEQKMIDEARKIWGDPSLKVAPTCVRVPVFRAHTESINITLKKMASEAEVREALRGAPGVRVVDDRKANRFPTPQKASGGDDVLVGRIRPDTTQAGEGGKHIGFELLASSDQLRKGAALNAIQIAEALIA
jgi:aspartate-semialdehyde dehydrogenase